LGTKYEVGISSFTIRPDRMENANMISYVMAGNQWAVQSGNPDGFDPEDICGFSVGVQVNTTQDEALGEMSAACPADNPLTVLTWESQADVTTNLVGGKVQAMWADSPVTQYAVGQTDGALELFGEITDSAPEGVVVAKEDTAMAEAVRAALQKLMDDGTLRAIFAAWGNETSALDTAEINPNVG
jgi:polar amino acid transport system substrate-binding protein